MSDVYEQFASKPRKGLSGGAKFGIGCGVVAVLAIILVCGGIGGGIYWVMGKIGQYQEEFTSRGYVLTEGQVVTVEEPVTQDTFFAGQAIRIDADVHANIAIGAQSADIRSRVDGDVDFLGQSITIHEGAVVTGDLRVRFAQAVIIRGRVEGEVTGSWQVIDRAAEATRVDLDDAREAETAADADPAPSAESPVPEG